MIAGIVGSSRRCSTSSIIKVHSSLASRSSLGPCWRRVCSWASRSESIAPLIEIGWRYGSVIFERIQLTSSWRAIIALGGVQVLRSAIIMVLFLLSVMKSLALSLGMSFAPPVAIVFIVLSFWHFILVKVEPCCGSPLCAAFRSQIIVFIILSFWHFILVKVESCCGSPLCATFRSQIIVFIVLSFWHLIVVKVESCCGSPLCATFRSQIIVFVVLHCLLFILIKVDSCCGSPLCSAFRSLIRNSFSCSSLEYMIYSSPVLMLSIFIFSIFPTSV